MKVEQKSMRLFPIDLPELEWVEFEAQGYSRRVAGVIHRTRRPAVCGMPLGSIDTGCIDLETSGLLGYSTIFNSHVPRRGPLNVPFLGISVKGHTWVLCDPTQTKTYEHLTPGIGRHPVVPGSCSSCISHYYDYIEPAENQVSLSQQPLVLDGVSTAKEIHYWGHYPVADLEFEIDAPVSVGLRAWAPFLPGNIEDSMIPGIVCEVHLRNTGDSEQSGTVAISFPGPTPEEAGSNRFRRTDPNSAFNGVTVETPRASYALGLPGSERCRVGGELGDNGAAWAGIARTLPEAGLHESGSSVAVDFRLGSGETKVLRFLIAWHSPEWNSGGQPASREGKIFTHMYAKYYLSVMHAAYKLVLEHKSLLRRILAWQEVIYDEESLPLWMREVLVNNFHLITELGMWAQVRYPVGDWCRVEDGIWGMNECPRGCPQIECEPCSYYSWMPNQFFFPGLSLSTLRAKKAYQFPDGCPTWIFGGVTGGTPPCDMTRPTHGYQTGQNGSWYAGEAARYWMRTGDDDFLLEFYPSLKKATIFTFTLNSDEPHGLISLPEFDLQEGYESISFKGMSSHVGSIRLYHLKMMEIIAEKVGDGEFASQCREWFKKASQLMEEHLWEGSYYLQHKDPSTGETARVVMGYQLDGEFMASFDGIKKGVFPEEHVVATLDKLKQVSMEDWGARVWSNPDGSAVRREEFDTGYWTPHGVHSPGALFLAMTYMYRGEKEFGLELARRIMYNMICCNRWSWDMPILYRGDTGEGIWGNDYGQMMVCWCLPAAVNGEDLKTFSRPGGLVDRIIKASTAGINDK